MVSWTAGKSIYIVNGAKFEKIRSLQLDNVRGILQPVDFACEIEGSVQPEGVNGV